MFSPDPDTRRKAAEAVFKSADPSALETLGRALERESDPKIISIMLQAQAVATLKSNASTSDKVAAIETIAARGDRDTLGASA